VISHPHTPIYSMICMGLIMMALPPITAAQKLTDPTAPPAEFVNLDNGSSPRPESTTPKTTSFRVQAVMIGRESRRAVINGQSVQQGDRIGQMKIIRIDHEKIVLQGESGMQTLLVNPAVSKTPASKNQVSSTPLGGTIQPKASIDAPPTTRRNP
jgi:hypothetical protein